MQCLMMRSETDLYQAWGKFLCLGLGLLYLGKQMAIEATLEVQLLAFLLCLHSCWIFSRTSGAQACTVMLSATAQVKMKQTEGSCTCIHSPLQRLMWRHVRACMSNGLHVCPLILHVGHIFWVASHA